MGGRGDNQQCWCPVRQLTNKLVVEEIMTEQEHREKGIGEGKDEGKGLWISG